MEQKQITDQITAASFDRIPLPEKPEDITHALVELGTMAIAPESAAMRDYYGRVLWDVIHGRFVATLSPADLEFYREFYQKPAYLANSDPRSAQLRRILHALGEVVCNECRRYGDWRLSMSADVLRLKSCWESYDPEMALAYLTAAREHVEVVHHRARYTGAADAQYARAMECAPDMGVMIDRFRKQREVISRPPTNAEFAEFIEKQIMEKPADYEHLRSEGHIIVPFVRDNPDKNFASKVCRGKMQGEGFLVDLMIHTTGYSERSIRGKVQKGGC